MPKMEIILVFNQIQRKTNCRMLKFFTEFAIFVHSYMTGDYQPSFQAMHYKLYAQMHSKHALGKLSNGLSTEWKLTPKTSKMHSKLSNSHHKTPDTDTTRIHQHVLFNRLFFHNRKLFPAHTMTLRPMTAGAKF